MGEHTERQFVYLREKLGRNTHPKRRAGFLDEELRR